VARGPAETATYLSIVGADGALVGAVADMSINRHIAAFAAAELRANPPAHLRYCWSVLLPSRWIVLDGNLEGPGLQQLLEVAASTGAKLAFVPASVPKLLALKTEGFDFSKLSLFIGNAGEVEALIGPGEAGSEAWLRRLGERFVEQLPRTAVVVTSRDSLCHCGPACRCFPTPVLVERPVSVIGAGDSFAGGFIAGTALGLDLEKAVALGQQAARLSVECEETVSPKLMPLLH
jgi:ribokinase